MSSNEVKSSNYEVKAAIAQLLKHAWSLTSSLSWSETKADNLQEHYDAILNAVQDKVKDVAPVEDSSVDAERKKRRKDKKDEKTI